MAIDLSDTSMDINPGDIQPSAYHGKIDRSMSLNKSATHFYQSSGERVGLIVASNRIALDVIDAASRNIDFLAEWGLRATRPLNGDVSVFESSHPIDELFMSRLVGSGLVERSVSVFENVQTGTEAVLLNEAIVSLSPGQSARDVLEGRSEFLSYRPLGGTPDQFVVTLAAGYGEAALKAIDELSNDSNFAWTAPNFHQAWQKFYLPNDPRFGDLWHLHNTGQSGGLVDADSDLPEAWDMIRGGSTTLTIGVVDDGVATNHPDLNVWINPGEIVGNGIDDDGNGWIDDINGWNFVNNNNVSIPTEAADGHGTAVAGVAAALGDNGIGVTGASYGTKVLAARIFAGNSVATDAGIAEAIYYAAGRTRNGSGTWRAGDISNHSWGGGAPSAAIDSALTWATSQGRSGKGSLQVFAAGNSGVEVGYPATQALVNSGIAVVGAVNNFGDISQYSSIGPVLDVVAPSNDFVTGTLAIDTTDRVGVDGYSATDYTGTGAEGFGGTSSAAPLATGIMALAIARGEQLNLDLSPAQLRALMRVNTDLLTSEVYDISTGKSYRSGYGRLNAASLVTGIGTREISVQSTLGEVASGSTVYDFGIVYVGDFVDAVFRIRNQGTSTLNLTDLTVDAGDFSISSPPADTVLDLGETTLFTVRFAPTSESPSPRTVRILSNDSDEPIFSFDLRGIGNVPNVTGNVYEDWNGEGSLDFDDMPIANHLVYLDMNRNNALDIYSLSVDNDTPLDIPDLSTVTSTIGVFGVTDQISDVNVTIRLNHTFVSDLEITLISPDGTEVTLASGVGGGGDNFTNTTFDDEAITPIASGFAPFTGSFRPTSPLSLFDRSIPNGTWQLRITDAFGLDVGTLISWSIAFQLGEPVATSSSRGSFLFDGLTPGQYRLSTTLPNGLGWTTLTSHDIEIVQSSDYYPGRDFGFFKIGRFYGKVFDDANTNGFQDSGEAGVPGQFLRFGNLGSSTRTITSSGQVPIIDLQTVTSPLQVDGLPIRLLDVNVTLNISHTWDEDLDVFLRAPDGKRVELFTDVGGSGDDFTGTILDDAAANSITSGTAPFTGTFRPEGSLATFNGINPNGSWALEVTDDTGFDVGTIQSWSLRIVADWKSQTDNFGRSYFDLPNGTHTIFHESALPWVPTLPSNSERTVNVPDTMFNETFGVRQLSMVTVNSNSVTGTEGTTIVQSGTWQSINGSGTVNLTASVGNIVKNLDNTWLWSIAGFDDTPVTTVTITANDGAGGTASVNFTYSVTNANPTVTAGQASVSGNVLSTLSNTGTWADVPADTVSLAASLGTVTKNVDGTWAWSFTPSQAYANQTVTITATDEDGGSSQAQFTINALVAVVNSKVYYKNSDFAGLGVNAALDASKVIAKSGAAAQALTFANLINTTRGINGLVFDVAGLAAANLTASDFVFRMSPTGNFTESTNPPSGWAAAPAPTLIDVISGNANTAARVRLEWADSAIANRWLQIKVLANANTGLATPQVYYIGHLLGETNGAIEGTVFRVRGTDTGPLVAAINNTLNVPVDNRFDLNKDGRVRGSDSTFAVTAVGQQLTRITIPPAGSNDEGEGDANRWVGAGSNIGFPKSEENRERKGWATTLPSPIGSRKTDAIFDVPLPRKMIQEISVFVSPHSAPLPQLSSPIASVADGLLSLESYFEELGRRPKQR